MAWPDQLRVEGARRGVLRGHRADGGDDEALGGAARPEAASGDEDRQEEDEAEKEYQESETRKAIDAKFNEGIPADSVAFTKPPVFS